VGIRLKGAGCEGVEDEERGREGEVWVKSGRRGGEGGK